MARLLFGLKREVFSALSEAKQLQMVRKFYFEQIPKLSNSNAFNIDSSIGSAIRNSLGLTMRKVIESGDDRTEVTVDTLNPEEKVKKSINLWENFRYFGTESCDFSIEKANLPENTIFYISQAYQSFKDSKKSLLYRHFYISSDNAACTTTKRYWKLRLNDNEVKFLRPRYDPVSGEFLGIEYCVAFVTVRNDEEEQFFDYGYNKANSKVLYSTRKLKVPSSFKTTIFGQHKIQYEGGAFDEQKFSKLFFYLPATVDRNEKTNKYLTSVHLKPFHVDPAVFGEKFNPADPNFDRAVVVSYMRKVAQQSSQNLKRNVDAFLSSINHDNEKLLWPGGKRTLSDKFALSY